MVAQLVGLVRRQATTAGVSDRAAGQPAAELGVFVQGQIPRRNPVAKRLVA
ncbi:hypothetical protein HN588_08545 [Candidatus Bathyarchaeota archaeon]|nr:hypothetical protein [Candidatus Bathyarchaeota archaeon]